MNFIRSRWDRPVSFVQCALLRLSVSGHAIAGETWRGLTVAPEQRCSPYNQGDYRYPQSVEPRIVAELGMMYGPYTGRCFSSTRQTDIDHIVARSEAHDSGLCAADPTTRRRFAADLLNLTLAAPELNRHAKRDHDASEWLPPMNRCWFTHRIVEARHIYGLTVDRREADALERVLSSCSSTELVVHDCGVDAPVSVDSPDSPGVAPSGEVDALFLWDDNRNGRITCATASPRCHADIPPILSCETATVTAWSASRSPKVGFHPHTDEESSHSRADPRDLA